MKSLVHSKVHDDDNDDGDDGDGELYGGDQIKIIDAEGRQAINRNYKPFQGVGLRASQLSHPTIDPATGLPVVKKKGKKEKIHQPNPDMAKTCGNCREQGTMFAKEGFDYCSMGCLTAHKSTDEFAACLAENEKTQERADRAHAFLCSV